MGVPSRGGGGGSTSAAQRLADDRNGATRKTPDRIPVTVQRNRAPRRRPERLGAGGRSTAVQEEPPRAEPTSMPQWWRRNGGAGGSGPRTSGLRLRQTNTGSMITVYDVDPTT